jgi:uncharacterized membrane-anchored protein
MTGQLLFGDAAEFGRLRSELTSRTPTTSAIAYLVSQSAKLNWDASNLLEIGQPDMALDTLRFSIGYVLFANWYACGNSITNWKTIAALSDSTVIKKVLARIRLLKSGNMLDYNEAKDLIEEWDYEMVKRMAFD